MCVDALIKFGVKKQVSQVSFKIVVGDLMSFQTFGYDMNLFGSYMILFGSDMILVCFSIQYLSLLLVVVSSMLV